MTDWTQKILNQYANKQAAGGNRLTLESFMSAPEPTEYDMKGGNFISGFNNGINNLIKFAQTGDRRRAEARDEAIAAEEVNYQREQDAANMALKKGEEKRADARFKLDNQIENRALLREQQQDEAAARTATMVQQVSNLNNTEKDYRNTLGELARTGSQYGLFAGSEDGKNLIMNGDTTDVIYKDYLKRNTDVNTKKVKEGTLSEEDFTATIEGMRNKYQIAQKGLGGIDVAKKNIINAHNENYLHGLTTASKDDDYTQAPPEMWNTATQNTVSAGDKAKFDERIALLTKASEAVDKARGTGEMGFMHTSIKQASDSTKTEAQIINGVIEGLDDNSKNYSEEIRNDINKSLMHLRKNNPTSDDSTMLAAAIQGTLGAIGSNNVPAFGTIDSKTALENSERYMQNWDVLKLEAAGLDAEKARIARNTLVEKAAHNVQYMPNSTALTRK